MKKVLLTLTLLLVISCSKSDKDYIEYCADRKTAEYWNGKADNLKKEILELEYKIATSINETQKNSATKSMQYKTYLFNYYSNASKKKLKEKLVDFPFFESNFKNCEEEFRKNPIFFKERYK